MLSQNLNFDQIIEKIKKADSSFLTSDFDKKILLDNYNYILTDKAKERLEKLYTYISHGTNVLLEGETGCSKTLSAEIICKYIYDKNNEENSEESKKSKKKEFIKFNLSSEVKINDLMQKFIGDKNSLSGIKIIEGPFLKAFKEGIPLILDEINLAPEKVLQCIEDTLDSDEINTYISGIGKIYEKKEKGFCLIATQNPNKGNYMNKRQNLSKSFLSHFQIIKFPCFEIDELKEIAENLFKSFNNGNEGDEKDNKFISDLINFHKIWTSREEYKNEIECFTIREIAATVKAYINQQKKNPFKIVKVIYSSRYHSEKKKEILELIGKYDSFKQEYIDYLNNGSQFQIPEQIKDNYYENNSLKEILESSLFSLKMKRNIMIVGNPGSGKSYIAKGISQIYNPERNYYHFICTEETKISDLIGYISPIKKVENDNNEGNEGISMEWIEGFLSKSIENGNVVILDNLHEANSTITERLNGLLDKKYDENKKKATIKEFDIAENPLKNAIKIHDDFRIIGICDNESINKMIPAFLNRFDIIVLENQIKNINNNEFEKLIKILLNKYQNQLINRSININISNKKKKNKKIKNKKNKENILSYFSNPIDIEDFLKKYKNDILDKFRKFIDKNETITILEISKFCYSLIIFLQNEELKKKPKDIIYFIYDLLFSEQEIQINNYGIKDILLKILKEKMDKKSDIREQFIFEGNDTLENYILIIFSSFLITLNLCIIGPPGAGKTSSAKYISEILQDTNYKLFNFHRTTKPNDLYGTLNLKHGEIEYYKGPLRESVIKGFIFIADEMNLSSISTMKSIAPVLDTLLNKNILIPGLYEPIDIDNNFFFISCQNEADSFGRNYIPDILKRKLKIIHYPKQTEEEIKNICKKLRYKICGNHTKFSENDSELLGLFMINYNKMIDEFNLSLSKWSFRDIEKIIKRINEHIMDKDYSNFNFYHFIYFYLFSSIYKDDLEKKINFNNKNKNENLKDLIHNKFISIFNLNETDSKELLNSYTLKPKLDISNNLIKKGNLGIKFNFENNESKILVDNNSSELPNYYDGYFKLRLSARDEPIILMGPSSYKTYLSEFYIRENIKNKFDIIYLNQKTTIEELLGGPIFISQNISINFYYDLLYEIIESQINEEIKRENFENINKNEIEDLINKVYKKSNIIAEICRNIKQNIEKCKSKKISKPQLVFKPGSILLNILKNNSLIIKDIHKVSTEVFERFNELFSSERILSLNEDIYNTFFNENIENKIIDLKLMNNIQIIATSPENSFQSLSDAILSRFSIICVDSHDLKEKEKIIKNYYLQKTPNMKDEILEEIILLLKDRRLNNIKKIKNLIHILEKVSQNNSYNNNKFNEIKSYIMLNEKNNFKRYEQNPLIKSKDVLSSNVSNLEIKINSDNNIQENKDNVIAFTPLFNQLLDLLHFGICTGTPIILEGFPGQGKQKAINYICELLNYEIENIVITNNFSYKELYKKSFVQVNDQGIIELIDIETKLFKKLFTNSNDENDKNTSKKTIFLFHNIHLADSNVLSKISEIFNKKPKDNTYSFIGLVDIKESLFDRYSYYYNYFYNSIYFIVQTNNEIDNSFLNQILTKDFEIDKNSIIKYFNNKEGENKFTYSDIIKYKKIKEISQFDNSLLEELIFKNKYDLNKNCQLKDESINNLYDIDLYYKCGKEKNLIMELNDKSIKFEVKEELKNFGKLINTLSFKQKKCLLFLGLSVLSKLPCIIQGKTGVGKSHLIKLFAKILGKKLHIFELTKDNDISLLTKNYIFKKNTKEEIKEIRDKIDEILNGCGVKYEKLNLIEKFKKLSEIKDLDSNYIKILNDLREKYKFIKRFSYENSEFLNAIIEGEWVLLDGIENSSPSITQVISPLCGENPELNLYDKNIKTIKPGIGFQLFMTYNPERITNNNTLNKFLLDKCLIYYLESFLDDEISMSQIVYGFLDIFNFNYDSDIVLNISLNLSKIFSILKKELNEKSSEKISERTIINFCKNLNFNEDIPLNIKNNFLYFFYPSLNKDKRNDMVAIINDNIDKINNNNIIIKNYSTECKKQLKFLKEFKTNIESNIIQDFKFSDFLSFCLKTPFKYIKDLSIMMKKNIEEAQKNSYEGNFRPFYIFYNYFNKLNELYKNERDNNLGSKLIEKYDKFPIVNILILFDKLNQTLFNFNFDFIDLLYDNINIFEAIKELHENQNLNYLEKLLEAITNNIQYIQDILNIFPYFAFINTKFNLLNDILKYIIKTTANNKINFMIKNSENEFNFKYTEKENDNIKIILDLNLNEKKELVLTKKTQIKKIKSENDEIDLIKNTNIEDVKNFNSFIINQINKQILGENEIYDIQRENEYNFHFILLFKNNYNLITCIWSIFFLTLSFKVQYLSYFLEINSMNLESEVYNVLLKLYNEIIEESSNNPQENINKRDKIIQTSFDLYDKFEKYNNLYNLVINKNYMKKFESINEKKTIKNELNNELNQINKLQKDNEINNIFIQKKGLLEKEIIKLEKEIKEIEIMEKKKKLIKQIEDCNMQISLKNELIEEIKNKKDKQDLSNIENLIENHNNESKDIKNKKKIKLFYDENIIKKKNYNKNVILMELLMKYSEIKDIIIKIKNNKKNNKLKYLYKLNKIIDKNYATLFNSFLIHKNEEKEEKDNIQIEDILCSLFIKDLISSELQLESNFLNIKKIINNLYNPSNSDAFDKSWCKSIEKKYKYNFKIYFPNLNNYSLLYLFIRIKKYNSKDKIRGFLFDSLPDIKNIEIYESLFNNLNIDKNEKLELLLLKIGNLLNYYLFNKKNINNIELLCNSMKSSLRNNGDKIKNTILDYFLKLKNIYLNYKNEEILEFDDIAKGKNKIFSIKYPSLINYLNMNNDIYQKILNEKKIWSFQPSFNYIPLWILLLRTFANISNIVVDFKSNNNSIISKFEEDIKKIIIKMLSNSDKNKNNYYILLISNNNSKIINNKEYEIIYKLFYYIIRIISINIKENQLNYLNPIKSIFIKILEDAYNQYQIDEITILKFMEKIKEIIFNNMSNLFYSNKYLNELKSKFNNCINMLNDFKNILNKEFITIKKSYNQCLNRKKDDLSYNNMKKNCDYYNYMVENKETNSDIFKEKYAIIQKYVDKKDANYIYGWRIASFFYYNKIEIIKKEEFIEKYKNEKQEINIYFGKGNKINYKIFYSKV